MLEYIGINVSSVYVHRLGGDVEICPYAQIRGAGLYLLYASPARSTITFRVLKVVGILFLLLIKNLLVCICNSTILPPICHPSSLYLPYTTIINTSTSSQSLRISNGTRASTVLATPSLSCFARASASSTALTVEPPFPRLLTLQPRHKFSSAARPNHGRVRM